MTIAFDPEKLQPLGDNISVTQVEDKLIIVVDLKEEIGLSSTGKMMGIASSGGFTLVPLTYPEKIKMNLYVGKRP